MQKLFKPAPYGKLPGNRLWFARLWLSLDKCAISQCCAKRCPGLNLGLFDLFRESWWSVRESETSKDFQRLILREEMTMYIGWNFMSIQ